MADIDMTTTQDPVLEGDGPIEFEPTSAGPAGSKGFLCNSFVRVGCPVKPIAPGQDVGQGGAVRLAASSLVSHQSRTDDAIAAQIDGQDAPPPPPPPKKDGMKP